MMLEMHIQLTLDILKLWGRFFTSSNYLKCKLICTSGNLDLLKSPQRQIMVGESNQNVFLIQIDSSSLAEFEIFEFEVSRFNCTFSFNIILALEKKNEQN